MSGKGMTCICFASIIVSSLMYGLVLIESSFRRLLDFVSINRLRLGKLCVLKISYLRTQYYYHLLSLLSLITEVCVCSRLIRPVWFIRPWAWLRFVAIVFTRWRSTSYFQWERFCVCSLTPYPRGRYLTLSFRAYNTINSLLRVNGN